MKYRILNIDKLLKIDLKEMFAKIKKNSLHPTKEVQWPEGER